VIQWPSLNKSTEGNQTMTTPALRELGKRLAAMLDEDDWAHIEPFLLACDNETAALENEIDCLEMELDSANQQLWDRT
jgi:hypothetical protein